MSRQTLIDLTRRTLAHATAGTVPLAPSTGRVPAKHYVDPTRWSLEIERIFLRLPLIVALSCELPSTGDYRALDIAGSPILVTRGADGRVRAFVNSCAHRGAVVVAEGSGNARRFVCPYHAWTYDSGGQLVGILDRAEFGEPDPRCHGLVELPCTELAGLVFASIDPDAELDVEAFLCGYGAMLAQHGFDRCTYVGSQSVVGPNWKVAYDGYLDFYHLPILHKATFGPDTCNKAIYDAWGPHQRVSSPDDQMVALAEKAPEEWGIGQLTQGVWTVFPHASIANFTVPGGRVYMISTLYPGGEVGSSVTVQHFVAAFEPTAEQAEALAAQMAFLERVVRDEDYATGRRLQAALAARPDRDVLFGRNEAGGQRFHRWVEQLVNAATAAETSALFVDVTPEFQP